MAVASSLSAGRSSKRRTFSAKASGGNLTSKRGSLLGDNKSRRCMETWNLLLIKLVESQPLGPFEVHKECGRKQQHAQHHHVEWHQRHYVLAWNLYVHSEYSWNHLQRQEYRSYWRECFHGYVKTCRFLIHKTLDNLVKGCFRKLNHLHSRWNRNVRVYDSSL